MIDTRQLRLDNLVNTPQPDLSQFRIDSFDFLTPGFCKVEMQLFPNTHGLTWELKDLSPIELSGDILEKLGFKQDCKCFWSKDGFEIMTRYTEEMGDFFHYTYDHIVLSTARKYVHQLQNMYYEHVGEELPIDNLLKK